MTVKAAKRMGCVCVVLDPLEGSPAAQVAGQQIIGDYHDSAKIRELAARCDVLTFELENIDADTLADLEAEGVPVHPSPAVLKTIQDKLTQKQFLADNGIPTSPFIAADQPSLAAFEGFGFPLVQKARRGGYDGRGVAVMQSPADFAKHLPVPSLVEGFVKAQKEIAVLVARSTLGEVKCFPVIEMCMRPGENVLDLLFAPADITPDVERQAMDIAQRTVEALDGIGIFGVEMFVDENNQVLVNEIAPRSHNSGHHTIEANVTDQFEQHLRAILGLPLGSTDTLCPAAMVNLLGAPDVSGTPVIQGLEETLAMSGVCLHLYGKAKTHPFRKMGHVTILDQNIEAAMAKARQVRDTIAIHAEEA